MSNVYYLLGSIAALTAGTAAWSFYYQSKNEEKEKELKNDKIQADQIRKYVQENTVLEND